jgi:putative cell wall-binding protein
MTRPLALLAALAIAAAVPAGMTARAGAEEAEWVAERIAGSDRYATAAAIAEVLGPADGPYAMEIYLASGTNWPDAIAAGAALGAYGPTANRRILLTDPAKLPDATIAQLRRTESVHRVTIVGGPAAVSPAVEAELAALGYAVDRVAGANRYETAIALMREYAPSLQHRVVFVASGLTFQDGVIGGAVGASQHIPLLLSDPDALTPAVAAELQRLAPDEIHLLGSAPSAGVEAELQRIAPTKRIAGASSIETSAMLAEQHGNGNATYAILARPDDYADALVAAGLAHRWGSPVFFSSRDCVSDDVLYMLNRLAAVRPADAAAGRLVLVGGTAALGDGVARLERCTSTDVVGTPFGPADGPVLRNGQTTHTVGSEHWRVWICRIHEGASAPAALPSTAALADALAWTDGYFAELSVGRYRATFQGAGEVTTREYEEIGGDHHACMDAILAAGEDPDASIVAITDSPSGGGRAGPSRTMLNGGAILGGHLSTVAHELGHAMSWPHQERTLTPLSRDPRADLVGFHALNRYEAGWFDQQQVEVHDGTTRNYLVEALGGDGTQMVVVPSPDRLAPYVIGARVRAGVDAPLPDDGVQVMLIDQRQPIEPSAPDDRDLGFPGPDGTGLLQPGDSVELGGATVRVVARTVDGFEIEVAGRSREIVSPQPA